MPTDLMSQPFPVRRRRPRRASVMHARRGASALAVVAAPPGVFPGTAMPEPATARERLVSSALAIFIHALLIGAIGLAAYLTPEAVVEQLIKVTLPDATRDKDPSGSPRPRAIAESSGRFAPAPMALQAHVINPAVIQARAANIAAAQQIQVETVAPIAAPREIQQLTTPVVERARTYQSIATVTATPVDTSAASAQISGSVDIQAPVGVVVGPRQVTTTGATVGIGGPTSLGTGSSVREGIASGRDVVGSKTGERAGIYGAYGAGGGRGLGGDGTGAGGGMGREACLDSAPVSAYIERVRVRMLARWKTPASGERGAIQLAFRIDPAGGVGGVEVVEALTPALGSSGVEALRSASPFEPMSDAVRCLAGQSLIGTFSNK